MLSVQDAVKILKNDFPDGIVGSHIEYKDLYIFQMVLDLPFETGLDPFFSVNKTTGVSSDFSILTDGDPAEIERLFMQVKADK